MSRCLTHFLSCRKLCYLMPIIFVSRRLSHTFFVSKIVSKVFVYVLMMVSHFVSYIKYIILLYLGLILGMCETSRQVFGKGKNCPFSHMAKIGSFSAKRRRYCYRY